MRSGCRFPFYVVKQKRTKDTTFQPIAEVLNVLGAGGFQVKMVTQPRGL